MCNARSVKVALVERDDFAAGTSSKSTKLIHGGIRYISLHLHIFLPVTLATLATSYLPLSHPRHLGHFISSSQSPSPPWPPMRVLGPACVPLPPLFSIGHRCVPLIILLCSIGRHCANHLSCIDHPWSFSRHSLQPCTRTLRDSQVPCTGVPVEGSTRVTDGRLPQPAVRSLCPRSHTSSNSLSAAHHTQHSALTITQHLALTKLVHHHFSPPLITRHHHHHHHHRSPLTTHHSLPPPLTHPHLLPLHPTITGSTASISTLLQTTFTNARL